MAATSKLSFRARNLDASKPMPVYVADELPDLSECTPINRAVAQMPTGMEKDEEMESHLQEAILAQQACTSGIKVENHVIPTPKVILLDDDYYQQLYPSQSLPFKNRLIKVQASLSVEREQPEYDADSEDELWLAGKDIPINDFEKMMELLESASSDLQICQPREAQSLLKEFDDNLVDDVYDYWLQKRKVAAAIRKTASLIPRIKTDSRRDAPGVVNPYVAFRRRAEKMQTRKNRKNDEESYEKILKLGYDMGKALSLFDMVKKREKTKAALIALEEKIFVERRANSLTATSNGDALLKPKPEFFVSFEDVQDENAVLTLKSKSQKRKKHGWSATVSALDKDVVTRAWLKKNAEVWNKPPVGITWLTAACSTSAVAASEAERTAADAEAAADGRFAFKRRRGCVYRASLPVATLSSDVQLDGFDTALSSFARSSSNDSQERKITSGTSTAFRDLTRHLYRTLLPSTAAKGVRRCIGFARRRVGRGGRIIFDRFLDSPPSTSQSASEEFPYVFDSSRIYQPKPEHDGGIDSDSSFESEDEREKEKRAEVEYAEREEIYRKRIFDDVEDLISFPIGADTSVNETTVYALDSNRSVYSVPNSHAPSVSGYVSQKSRSSANPAVSSSRPSNNIALDVGVSTYNSYQTVYANPRQTGYAAPFAVNGIPTTLNGKTIISSTLPSTSSCENRHQERRVMDGHVRFASSVSPLVSSQQLCDEPRSGFYSRLPQSMAAARIEETGGAMAGDSVATSLPYKQRQTTEQRLPVIPRIQQRRNTDSFRVNGVKRPKVSLSPTYLQTAKSSVPTTVTQRSPSIVAESGLKRLPYMKLNGDASPQLNQCVDTKRLELAIAGSGARIKAPVLPNLSSAGVHTVGIEPHTPLIDVLKGTMGKPIHNPVVNTFSSCNYQTPHVGADATDTLNIPSQKSSSVNSYYAQTDGLGGVSSSPDSDSMSPPNSTSLRCCSERTSFSNVDGNGSHPVAVVSGRPNGVIAMPNDSQKCGVLKQWSGNETGLRKRSYEFSQLSQHEICSPPRTAIAAVPCSTASMRLSAASPMIAVPQDTDGYSETLITHSRSDASGISASAPPVAYFVPSSLAEHSNEISVSEGPLVG